MLGVWSTHRLPLSALSSQFHLVRSLCRHSPHVSTMMLRPLRRQAVYLKSPRTSPRSPFLTQVRRQHQKEEKWYFQNQDQSAPQTLPPTVPDGSPVVLPSNVHTGKARSRPFDYKRSLLWAFAAGLSGWLAAAYITRWAVLSMTAPFPEPGSPQDKTKLAAIVKRFEAQEVVKTMRESGDWKEWEAYSNLEPGDRMHRLTSGPLSGSRGLALQVGGLSDSRRKRSTPTNVSPESVLE